MLVYAQRQEFPDHERYREWLETTLNGDEPVAFVGPVVSGFLRVVTNRRIFVTPTPLTGAIAHLETMLGAPAASDRPICRGPACGRSSPCLAGEAAGDLVSDAYLAAVATGLSAELVSADRDFSRFPGLRWSRPLAQ